MREKGKRRKESMKTNDIIKVSHFDANPIRILKIILKNQTNIFVCFLSRGDGRLSREMANTLKPAKKYTKKCFLF
jgi:hypothetical protein